VVIGTNNLVINLPRSRSLASDQAPHPAVLPCTIPSHNTTSGKIGFDNTMCQRSPFTSPDNGDFGAIGNFELALA
jgi:hypothetical protein